MQAMAHLAICSPKCGILSYATSELASFIATSKFRPIFHASKNLSKVIKIFRSLFHASKKDQYPMLLKI